MLTVFLGGIVLFFICTRSTYTGHSDSVHQNPIIDCIKATDNCPNDGITFFLYRKDNEPTQIEENTIDDIEFSTSNILKILIHGIKGKQDGTFNKTIRDAYLKIADYNIITVVYTPLGPSLKCYEEALFNMEIIAKCTVRLLQKILKKKSDIKHRHIIGFSLGAEIAGVIAKIWNKEYENEIDKLERITGLDPALPGLENGRSVLNANSATVVDVIHTNSGVLGQISPIGTVDFYANGGIRQPGCDDDIIPEEFCHHHRAYYYFAKSIEYKETDEGFYATSSGPQLDKEFSLLGGIFKDVHVRVGEYIATGLQGVYFFDTNSQSTNDVNTASTVLETPQPDS